MKVRLVLDVNAFERYVIARYFRPVAINAIPTDRTRTRATRKQVRRFVTAALKSAVREQAQDVLDARARTVADRLRLPKGHCTDEHLTEPKEKQKGLPI